METKYKFIDSRVTSLDFEENIFGGIIGETKFSVGLATTIMTSKKESNKHLISFKFDIRDEDGDFKFKVEIVNRIELLVEENDKFDEILQNNCLPNLLGRSRKMIKNITIAMNIPPLELPPFDDEIN